MEKKKGPYILYRFVLKMYKLSGKKRVEQIGVLVQTITL